MYKKINLENLSDLQKVWLCDLSFVDITEEGYKKIVEQCITIEELKDYVKNPDLPYCGDILLGSKNFNIVTGLVLGNNQFPSNLDVVYALIDNGLGSLKIIHASEYPQASSSSFQALTFEDDFGNVGISYRGSDLYISRVVVREWLESNFLEYFSNSSTQVNEALEYFLKNQNPEGNNYIYGHSLGGNLVSHVYLNYHDRIKQAVSINGTPINQKLINTENKIVAFNDPKFQFNVVCGDIIGQLKSCEVYKENVNYIKNNKSMKPSFLSAHMIQSSTFDENGNFVKITKEEMEKQMNHVTIKLINLSKFVRESMNKVNFKLISQKNHQLINDSVNKTNETYKKYK